MRYDVVATGGCGGNTLAIAVKTSKNNEKTATRRRLFDGLGLD